MLLTVDVGNTNITLGLFKGDKVFANLRLKTQSARTSDEYGSLIAEMIVRKGIDISSISDVIIASVVPKVMWYNKVFWNQTYYCRSWHKNRNKNQQN